MEENQRPRPAFILPERGEKLAGWIYFPFYIVLISLGLSFLFMTLGRNVTAPRNLLLMNLIYGAINFCVLTLCFRRYLRRCAGQVRQFPGRFFAAVGIGVVIYYLGTILITIPIQMIEPGLENINDSNIEQIAGSGMLLMIGYTVLLVPTVEELMFRGLIFSSLRPRSRFLAYAVSMLAFSALHVLAYIGQYPVTTLLLCLVQYLPASFALAWALEFSGSIWASIGVHTIANCMAMAAMAFSQHLS